MDPFTLPGSNGSSILVVQLHLRQATSRSLLDAWRSPEQEASQSEEVEPDAFAVSYLAVISRGVLRGLDDLLRRWRP